MTFATKARGVIFDVKNQKFRKEKLVVRFTSDTLGESLSISDDKEIMLEVDFRKVEKLIAETRGRVKRGKDDE